MSIIQSIRATRRLDERGVAALEFALLAPVLILIVLGGIQFGYTMSNYEVLSSAVRSGARQFAISRGDANPMTETVNQIYSAAPNLAQASLTITLAVNGTTCASDGACSSALSSGLPATVNATYPCSLKVGGINFAPSCTLSANTTERVE